MGESLSPWLEGGNPGFDAEGSPQENTDLRLGGIKEQLLGDPKAWVTPGDATGDNPALLCQAAAPPQPEPCSRRD